LDHLPARPEVIHAEVGNLVGYCQPLLFGCIGPAYKEDPVAAMSDQAPEEIPLVEWQRCRNASPFQPFPDDPRVEQWQLDEGERQGQGDSLLEIGKKGAEPFSE
jgi:hypothetical protein